MATETSHRPTTQGAGKDGRYHHGDLRRALLDAALHLASERGIGAFTLREVARQAGVSHNAPYHHFPDKAALIEALAVEGFDALRAATHAAWEAAPGTALDKLHAVSGGYVRFALEHRALYRFMFWPELRRPAAPAAGESLAAEREMPQQFLIWMRSPVVEDAARASYRVLVEAIIACQADGSVAPGDPAPLAFTAWATVHGLAVLLIETPPDDAAGGAGQATDLAAIVATTLIHGLAAR